LPKDILAVQQLLPELSLLKQRVGPRKGVDLFVEKRTPMEVCPRCATRSWSVYDRRWAVVRDEPMRRYEVRLIIRKRRFMCGPCGRPFTEPVQGIIKGKRTTERYARAVQEACDEYVDLKQVRRRFRCSAGYLYATYYRHLELKQRMRQGVEWGERVALDEHSFKRGNVRGRRRFVTMVVDESRKRLLEVADGRTAAEVEVAVAYIPGRDNVRWVSMDLCDPYKKFATEFFPNAQIVADKFHVLRLPQNALMKYRKQAEGGRNTSYLRNLLLGSGYNVPHQWREPLKMWLSKHPVLNEVYRVKEKLSAIYRIKSVGQAALELTQLTDRLAISTVPELRSLRQTLRKWRLAILNYWTSGRQTNARVEGFNLKAKLVKRRAYGYISSTNYRLRLLNACGA
jgi:transposase